MLTIQNFSPGNTSNEVLRSNYSYHRYAQCKAKITVASAFTRPPLWFGLPFRGPYTDRCRNLRLIFKERVHAVR